MNRDFKLVRIGGGGGFKTTDFLTGSAVGRMADDFFDLTKYVRLEPLVTDSAVSAVVVSNTQAVVLSSAVYDSVVNPVTSYVPVYVQLTHDLPLFTLNAVDTSSQVTATLPLVVSSATAIAVSAPDYVLPALDVASTGFVGLQYYGLLEIDLPPITVVAVAGEQKVVETLPLLTSTATTTIGEVGSVFAVLGAATCTSRAIISSSGDVTATLPTIVLTVTPLIAGTGVVEQRLDVLTARITGFASVVCSFSNALGTFDIVSNANVSVTTSVVGSTTLLVMSSLAARPVTHMATYSMNTQTFALSEYSNFQFNSFAVFKGKTYATGSIGLYEVTGSVDDTAPVVGSWKHGNLDMGTPQQKRVADAYLSMIGDGDATMTVTVDRGTEYGYTISAFEGGANRQRKCNVGKGLKGKYWQFGFEKEAPFEVDEVLINEAKLDRRV